MELSGAAEDRAEAADDDAGDAEDDQPHALVGGRAGDYFLGAGSDGVVGIDAEDQEDDADNEDREEDRSVHGICGGEVRWIGLDRGSDRGPVAADEADEDR